MTDKPLSRPNDELVLNDRMVAIRSYLDQPLMKFDTREGLYNDAAEGKRIIYLLLSDREKLIDSMKYAIKFMDHVPLTDARTAMAYTNLKDTLKEIGVNQS